MSSLKTRSHIILQQPLKDWPSTGKEAFRRLLVELKYFGIHFSSLLIVLLDNLRLAEKLKRQKSCIQFRLSNQFDTIVTKRKKSEFCAGKNYTPPEEFKTKLSTKGAFLYKLCELSLDSALLCCVGIYIASSYYIAILM